jgi:hypothetical protein
MVSVTSLEELKSYLSKSSTDVNFYVKLDDQDEPVSYLPMYHGPIDKYLHEGKLKVDCKSWINKEVFKGTVLKK